MPLQISQGHLIGVLRMTLWTQKMIRKSLNILHIRIPGAIRRTILGCVTGILPTSVQCFSLSHYLVPTSCHVTYRVLLNSMLNPNQSNNVRQFTVIDKPR